MNSSLDGTLCGCTSGCTLGRLDTELALGTGELTRLSPSTCMELLADSKKSEDDDDSTLEIVGITSCKAKISPSCRIRLDVW